MKEFKLTQELGNTLLNYLAQKPWVEVKDMIEKLQNLEEIKEIKDKK